MLGFRSCILPTLSVLWLMLTAFRDPGIIPRQEPDVEYLSGQKPRCAPCRGAIAVL